MPSSPIQVKSQTDHPMASCRDSPNDNEEKGNQAGGEASSSHQPPTTPTMAAETEHDIITKPGPNDVLMGRGAPSTDFPGNMQFRDLVRERRHEYINARRRKDKQVIAGEIIATVKKRGGRFLERLETIRKPNQAGGTKKVTIWEPVDDHKTLLVKVKQLMRDVGPEAQEKRNLRREKRRAATHKEEDQKEFCNPEVQTSNSNVFPPPASQQVIANQLPCTSPSSQSFSPQFPLTGLTQPRGIANGPIAQLPRPSREVELRLLQNQLLREQQIRLLMAQPSLAAQPWSSIYQNLPSRGYSTTTLPVTMSGTRNTQAQLYESLLGLRR